MPKLDSLKEELHFDKQLIIAAIIAIAVTLWTVISNISTGWPLIVWAAFVLIASMLVIIKKRRRINELLQEIEDC